MMVVGNGMVGVVDNDDLLLLEFVSNVMLFVSHISMGSNSNFNCATFVLMMSYWMMILVGGNVDKSYTFQHFINFHNLFFLIPNFTKYVVMLGMIWCVNVVYE